MKNTILIIMLSTIAIKVTAVTESPYKGQQSRAIKALSQREIDGYLTGKGMGYAKAAELNDYPGPRHVLDLAKELALTAVQKKKSQAIFNTMKSSAVTLGKQLVGKEKELDRKFANRQIDASTLASLVSEIGVLEAKIRKVHLVAHLEQRKLLSRHQIQQYKQLRGYGSAHNISHHHTH